jgi:hypothetical protein
MFMGMLDADEFIVIRGSEQSTNLTSFLKPFETVGGLVVSLLVS